MLARTAHLGSGGLHQSKERKRAQRHKVRMGRASGFVAAPMIAGGPSGGRLSQARDFKRNRHDRMGPVPGRKCIERRVYPAVFANPITTGGAVDRSHDVRLAPRSGRTRTMRSSGRFALPIFACFGGGSADKLPARSKLSEDLRHLVEHGRLTLALSFSVERIDRRGDSLVVSERTARDPRVLGPVDRIIVCTGQRPDLSMTRELRLDLDPWLERARARSGR